MVTEFGKIIRKLRIDREINSKEMALSLQMSPGYISAIECGKAKVSSNTLNKILDFFNPDPETRDKIIKAAKTNFLLDFPISKEKIFEELNRMSLSKTDISRLQMIIKKASA